MKTDISDTPTIPADVHCVWEAGAILGEGPIWHNLEHRLFWTDIKGARLHAYRPEDSAKDEWPLPCRVGSIGVPPATWTSPPNLDGTTLLACGDWGLMWLGLHGREAVATPIADPESDLSDNRYNDGKVGPDGRYWAGTMHDLETEATGSLYAFSPEGRWTRLDSGYRVTNGPTFSPDGRTVYHNDSALKTIYAFDYGPNGTLMHKRNLLRFGDGEGYPDGMTTDRYGNLWVAMWGGARIAKISPDGARLGHVPIPTPQVTSCALQGDDETILYATSAAIGLEAPDALAGGLFRIKLR